MGRAWAVQTVRGRNGQLRGGEPHPHPKTPFSVQSWKAAASGEYMRRVRTEPIC